MFLQCSASGQPEHDSVEVMRRWHTPRPKGSRWCDVGYISSSEMDYARAPRAPDVRAFADDEFSHSDSLGALLVADNDGLLGGPRPHYASEHMAPVDRLIGLAQTNALSRAPASTPRLRC